MSSQLLFASQAAFIENLNKKYANPIQNQISSNFHSPTTYQAANTNMSEKLESQINTSESASRGFQRILQQLDQIENIVIELNQTDSADEKEQLVNQLVEIKSSFNDLANELESLKKEVEDDYIDHKIHRHITSGVQVVNLFLENSNFESDPSGHVIDNLSKTRLQVIDQNSKIQNITDQLSHAMVNVARIQTAYHPVQLYSQPNTFDTASLLYTLSSPHINVEVKELLEAATERYSGKSLDSIV